MDNFVLYIICLGLGGVGAWGVARLGRRFSLLAKANSRSSHHGVIPKGGGIGVLSAFLLASATQGLPLLFWICIGLISLFSFYGDRKEISAMVRLCMQILAGIGLLVGLFQWEGRSHWCYLLIPFASVFVAGTANYYNFMDGIDGIAAISGIVAFGLIVLFGVNSGANESLLILAGCMGFACLGFMPFNMPKARVFMGDVGSVLLGFVFAGLVVGLSYSLNDFLVLCAFLFPFYADELTTAYVRLQDGENLLKPHRRHVYQLLANEMGVEHWKVSMGYGVLQLIVGVNVICIMGYGLPIVLSMLTFYFAAFAVAGYYIRSAVATSLRSADSRHQRTTSRCRGRIPRREDYKDK